MKKRFGLFAAVIFAVVCVSPNESWAQPGVGSADSFTITVKVLNFAKVPSQTLQKGQAIAGQIFKAAGIELKWAECPCQTSQQTLTLSLRIIPKLFGSTMSQFRSDHLGFAAVNEDGGELATIFYDRIELQSRGGDASRLLGLATAHELGHLLLGSKAHTDEGIMQPHWTRKQKSEARRNPFGFTARQSEQIRLRVSKQQIAANTPTAGRTENMPSTLEIPETTEP